MKPHVSVITLGVRDMNRAKQFYSEGLGWPIQQDYGQWVSFSLGNGSSALGLYAWDTLADDAGVAPGRAGGFRGVTLSYIVGSDERVDAVLAEAERAGRHDCQASGTPAVGRALRLLRRSRRLSLESRVERGRSAVRRRIVDRPGLAAARA